MITSKVFYENWNKELYPLIKYDMDKISALDISKDAKNFLIEAGLPESAAPFMNFESSEKGGGTLLSEKLEECKMFSKYIYMGFTGDGDSICIVEKTSELVQLEHENEYKEIFINSSVPQFAESLLEYSEFVKKIKQINGRKAFLDKNAPQGELDLIYKKLAEIDSKSLNEKCFWKDELDYYKK